MLKVVIDYPKKEEEKLIVRQNMEKAFPKASTILKPEDIIRAREVVKDVYMDEKIEKYIIDIVFATRFPQEAGARQVCQHDRLRRFAACQHQFGQGAKRTLLSNVVVMSSPKMYGRYVMMFASPYRPDL